MVGICRQAIIIFIAIIAPIVTVMDILEILNIDLPRLHRNRWPASDSQKPHLVSLQNVHQQPRK